jgi:SAM-dependent methyltransferase
MSPGQSSFDLDASQYAAELARGLSVAGESAAYFAEGRVSFLADCLRDLRQEGADGSASVPARPRVLDFGCGVGGTSPLLQERLAAGSVLGLDTAAAAIESARQQNGRAGLTFALSHEHVPAADFDLAYTNGVFHHIPPEARPGALDLLFRSLRPGGVLSFWENNPWNPGTRYVMSRVPFDRDAVTLSPPAARRLLRKGGFEILRCEHLFLFPRALRLLRPLERRLARLPLGAQYQVLCRRP